MAKVKKTAVVTGVRNVKASKQKSGKPVKSRGASAKGRTAKKAGAGKSSKASKSSRASKVTRTRQAKAPKTKARTVSRVKSISKARAKAAKSGRARIQAPAPVVRVVVKPLEPQAKCGAGTSVQYLFRVDETVDGRTTTHLVFFDRHGWYCEHGRNCPAVGHAKKYQGHIARAS